MIRTLRLVQTPAQGRRDRPQWGDKPEKGREEVVQDEEGGTQLFSASGIISTLDAPPGRGKRALHMRMCQSKSIKWDRTLSGGATCKKSILERTGVSILTRSQEERSKRPSTTLPRGGQSKLTTSSTLKALSIARADAPTASSGSFYTEALSASVI